MSWDTIDEHHTTAVQASIDESEIDYYDIMVIGNTGQGKSTTADKILIANPHGHRYVAEYQPGQQPELTDDEHKRQLSYSDITMWLALGVKGGSAEFETHLKFLTYCRSKDMPHEEVNKARSASMEIFRPTIDCEVLSNETSKIRIMDVPGFFDGASIPSKQTEDARAEHQEPMSPVEHLDVNNLDIMRKIIRVQTTLAMKFKRILYFLPGRGPLERSNAHLTLELKWMAHYFGTAIFKSMILVATIEARFSKMPISDDNKFPQEDIDLTKKFFRDALKKVFSSTSERPLPDPPLIFISLTNTCEEILAKIQSTPVQQEDLYLQFDPNTCADCGVKIGVVKGQRVTCYFGDDLANAIPFEESTCHPFFVPRYTRIDKIWGGFKHLVTFRWATGKPWPVFDGEKCVACLNWPNTRGCMKVKSIHGMGRNKREVDHTSQVVNPVPDEEAAEGGNAGEATANVSLAYKHRQCEQHPAEGPTTSPIIQSQIERGGRPFKVSTALRLTLPVASDWKVIGALLDIPDHILSKIATDEAGVQNQLRAMLNALSCRRPPPTWEALAKAVEPFNQGVAEEIRHPQSAS